MALCKYCGRYTDINEWPKEFWEAWRPNLCFHCYEENPDRADYGHTEELPDTSTEEEETPIPDDEDPDEDSFDQPDSTDGETEEEEDPDK